MKITIKQILLLIAIVIDVGWMWFVLNFSLFGASIDYTERIPETIPFAIILTVLIILFIKVSKATTKKRAAISIGILVVAVLIAPVLFYLGLIGAGKLSERASYITATHGAKKIKEPIPMSQWEKSSSYEIVCDDFIPDNDTNNLYVYHEYADPWGNESNGESYWGYIFPNNTANYTEFVIGKTGTIYDDEPFVMRKGYRYTLEEIKQEDIGQYAKEHNPSWDTITEIKEDDGYVSGIVFNDTSEKIISTHEYLGKEIQVEIEPYSFVMLENGWLDFGR